MTDLLKDLFPEEEDFTYPTEEELNTRITLDRAYMYRKPDPEVRQAIASKYEYERSKQFAIM